MTKTIAAHFVLVYTYCCMFHGRCTRPSATVPSPLPLQKSGTRFRQRSRHYRHWRLSSAHLRRNCSVDHTATHTTGNSSIDTSVTPDTQRPWSFVRLASRWNSLMMMMMIQKLHVQFHLFYTVSLSFIVMPTYDRPHCKETFESSEEIPFPLTV